MTISDFALDDPRDDRPRDSAGGLLDRDLPAENRGLRGDRARKTSRRDRRVDRPRMGPFGEPRK